MNQDLSQSISQLDKMKITYAIVGGMDLTSLVKKVNEYTSRGWQPTTTPIFSEVDKLQTKFYYKEMIRVEEVK